MAFAHPHASTGTIHVGFKVKFKSADGCFRIKATSALLEESGLKGALTFKIVHGLIAPLVFLLALTFDFVHDQIAPSVFLLLLRIVQGLVAPKVFFLLDGCFFIIIITVFTVRDVESQQGQEFLSRDTAQAGLLFLFGWHGGVRGLAGGALF